MRVDCLLAHLYSPTGSAVWLAAFRLAARSRTRLASWRNGAKPQCNRVTAPRYKARNASETMMTASSAALDPIGEAEIGEPRKMAAVAKPATSEAAVYLQRAAV